jgi:CRP-like cAMP-binding protein
MFGSESNRSVGPSKHVTLGELKLFAGSTRRELEAISRLTTELDIREGTPMCVAGVTQAQFVIVLDGEVELTRRDEPFRRIGAGDWFGHGALLRGRPVGDETAVACRRTRVLVCSEREFTSLRHMNPRIEARLDADHQPSPVPEARAPRHFPLSLGAGRRRAAAVG